MRDLLKIYEMHHLKNFSKIKGRDEKFAEFSVTLHNPIHKNFF